MNSNIITTTKEDLTKAIESRANEIATERVRNMNPMNAPQVGYVKVKADHDTKNEQARIVGEYITALTKGKLGIAEDIANRANEKYLTRANFNTGTNAQGGFAVPRIAPDIRSFSQAYQQVK